MAEEQPNWNCDHCGGANPGVVNNHPVIACAHCGHPRDSADDTYEARTYAPGTVPRNDLEANPRQQPQQRRASKPPVRTSKQFHDSIFGPLLLTLIFAALIIITLASFIAPVTISDGVVSERSWERSIEVEELQSIRTSGWALPPGAELISEEMRVHKTIDVVVDHVPDTRTEMRAIKIGEETFNCVLAISEMASSKISNALVTSLRCSPSKFPFIARSSRNVM